MKAQDIIAALRASPALLDQVLEGVCVAGPWRQRRDGLFRISATRPQTVGHVWQEGGLWLGWALGQDLPDTDLSAEDAQRAVDAILVQSGWVTR